MNRKLAVKQPPNFHLEAKSNLRSRPISYGSTSSKDGDLAVQIFFRESGRLGGWLEIICREGSKPNTLTIDISFDKVDETGEAYSTENLSYSLGEWPR